MPELQKFLVSTLLKSLNKSYRGSYPQLASFSQDDIGTSIVSHGLYEEPLLICLRKQLFPNLDCGGIAIDIGANVGNHSVYFSNYFKEIHSFEPNVRTYYLLQANSMSTNNIITYNVGCSNREFTQEVSYSSENVGGASVETSSLNQAKFLDKTSNHINNLKARFVLVKLDSVLPTHLKNQVSFMKIDVEGHEKESLEGALEVISLSKPVIAFEANKSDIENGSTAAKDLLSSIGYKYFYYFQDEAPFHSISRRFAKLISALSVLIFNKKLLNQFKIKPISGPLNHLINYKMILASQFPIHSP